MREDVDRAVNHIVNHVIKHHAYWREDILEGGIKAAKKHVVKAERETKGTLTWAQDYAINRLCKLARG